MTTEEPKAEATYEAGCHCGYISLSVTLSPPLPEHEVLHCNCSICRRGGYLLVYPFHPKVTWHHDSEKRVSRYEFNTKSRDHMFCPKCGASIGIDFERFKPDKPYYGISASIPALTNRQQCVKELTTPQVRQFNDVDLDSLKYKKFDGIHKMVPAGDLSGVEINAETGEPTSSGSQK